MCFFDYVFFLFKVYKMFYTLATKLPTITNGKKILKIFLFGSICYVLLHYYIQTNQNLGFLTSLSKYFYYVMVFDFITAYLILKMVPNDKESVDKENDDKLEKDNGIKAEIENNLQELRAMQAMDIQRRQMINNQMLLEQQHLNRNNQENVEEDEQKSQKSPFLTKDEVAENEKKYKNKQKRSKKNNTKSTSTSTSSSTSSSVSEVKKHKKEKKENKDKKIESRDSRDSRDSDTQLPVYMG